MDLANCIPYVLLSSSVLQQNYQKISDLTLTLQIETTCLRSFQRAFRCYDQQLACEFDWRVWTVAGERSYAGALQHMA